MAQIWRRNKTTPDPAESPVASAVSGLTAASAPVPPARWGKIAKTPGGDRGKWQAEAWDMLDVVGELSFALLWKTALLSRFRLVASDIDPETGKPTGSTDHAEAKRIVAAIAGGATGQSQMLSRLAPLMMVPGEGWLAIIYPDGAEEWHILSSDEMKTRGTEVEIELPDGTNYTMRPEMDTLVRIWRPDPRRSSLAWSPVKAALPILRQIVRMMQNIEAAGKSRQAGNGILVLPNEVSMPMMPPPVGAPDPDAPNLPPPPPPVARFVTADQIRQALQKAMSTAIEDPSSAEALVPIILQVAGDFVDKIRHIRFDTEVSEKAQKALEAAVRRLAMTLDMPPEVLLGLADLNHWSLYGVEEEAVRWHASPEMETICDAFTRDLLQPMLGDGSNVVIWYDTSDVDAEPDRVEKVRQAYLDGVANAETYLRELALGEDAGYDLTTRDGWAAWATDQVRKDATLVPTLAPLLQLLVPALAEIAPTAPAAPAAPPQEQPAIEATPDRVPDTRDAMTAAARTAVRMCVNEGLRLAGARRRTRADHGRLREVPVRETHRHLGPVPDTEVDRLIDGWEEVLDAEVCASAGIPLGRLRELVRAQCRAELTTPAGVLVGAS
ncbi:hypothetical protein [Nocardia abscessus]|uniref:hypothetical protein n=1 Tax=Nocardia abscessus TaxID=120957 RepID=UPI002457EE31|nr:hypothetical protein [Nocardia abscessus]